jgi:predicted ATPase
LSHSISKPISIKVSIPTFSCHMLNRIYFVLLHQNISHGRHVVIFHFHTRVSLNFHITKHVSQYSNSGSYVTQWRGPFISQTRRDMLSIKWGYL